MMDVCWFFVILSRSSYVNLFGVVAFHHLHFREFLTLDMMLDA